MKRELKFRVWDAKAKAFVKYGCSFSIHDPCEIRLTLDGNLKIEAEYGNDILDKERFTVQQYTGLKDKNGREIYEGDIVSFDNSLYSSIRKKSPMIVKWDKGFFNVWHYLIENLEIIGNIFENPELDDKS